VDFPNGPGNTQLVGISNNNVALAIFTSNYTYSSFLYVNGVFKDILVPNSDATQVTDISANGVISGNAAFSDGSVKQFTASCK
jgi:hypothetical protein